MSATPPTRQLPRLSRRHFVIGALLAGASAATYAAQPEVRYSAIDKEKFARWVPDQVGPWGVRGSSGVVLPPPDAMQDRLYDNLVTRLYEAPGAPPIMLLIAYNNKQDGVIQLHRPEICYPAGGFSLSPTQPVEVGVAPGVNIPANMFTATGPGRIEQVLYWTRLGQGFPRSWLEQRISVMQANLRGDIPDGAMIRVSSVGDDQAAALQDLRGFLVSFFQAAPPELRRILAGGSQT